MSDEAPPTDAVAVRAAAITAVKAAMPALREVESHLGRFDLDGVKRFMSVCPSVRIAVLGYPRFRTDASGEIDCDIAMAAFVLTRDAAGLPKDTAAANIAAAIGKIVNANQWGLAGVHPAIDLRADNLTTDEIDKNGVALWAVSWTQPLRIGEDAFADDGTLIENLYVGMAPEIGADHKQDYRHVLTGEPPPEEPDE